LKISLDIIQNIHHKALATHDLQDCGPWRDAKQYHDQYGVTDAPIARKCGAHMSDVANGRATSSKILGADRKRDQAQGFTRELAP
jgi:hypothetical protein